MASPVILVEAAPRRAADGVAVTVRLAGGASERGYHYGGQHWRAGVAGFPQTVASLDFADGQPGGGGVAQAMVVRWAPAGNAALAEQAAFYWGDAAITVRIGPEGDTLPPAVANGRVLDTTIEDGELRIALADEAAALKKPLLTDRFAGTGDLAGPAEWDGQIKSRAWGRCFNVPGRCIDPAYNIWNFGDPARPWQAFDAVRDRGAAAAAIVVIGWQGTMAATLAALRAVAVPDGGCAACPSLASVRWWKEPSGNLHADIRGEIAGGYVETIPEIVARIAGATSALPFAAGAIAAAVAARPMAAGWRVDTESATAAGEISDLLGGASLSWVIVDGAIEFRRWEWSAPVRIARSEGVTRRELVKPVASRRLGYRRNWSPMARGDLVAIVLASEVVYDDSVSVEAAIAAAAADAASKNRTFPAAPQPPLGAAEGDFWPDTSGTPTILRRLTAGLWVATASNGGRLGPDGNLFLEGGAPIVDLDVVNPTALKPIGQFTVVKGDVTYKLGGTHGAWEGGAVAPPRVGGAFAACRVIYTTGGWTTCVALGAEPSRFDPEQNTVYATYAPDAGGGTVTIARPGTSGANFAVPAGSVGAEAELVIAYDNDRVFAELNGVRYGYEEGFLRVGPGQRFYPKFPDLYRNGPDYGLRPRRNCRHGAWADQAKAVAAQQAADAARADATSALGKIADIFNDGKVTPDEKPELKRRYDELVGSISGVCASADSHGVDRTDLTAKYTAWFNYVGAFGPDLLKGPVTVQVDTDALNALFKQVYDARSALLNAIAARLKANTDAVSTALGQTTASVAAILDDGVLDASEKLTLRSDWAVMQGERAGIIANAARLGVSSAAYAAAYDAVAAISGVWASGGNTPVDRQAFNQVLENYAIQKQALGNAGTGSAARTAVVGDGLVDLVGNSVGYANIFNNLARIDWWKRDAAIPWSNNGSVGALIYTLPHPTPGAWGGLAGPKGAADDIWLGRAGPDGGAGGGWDNGLVLPLDPDKTYRFVVPIAPLDQAASRSSYWGVYGVCDLNSTSINGNPYFAAAANLPPARWYLFVGYIFPRNSTGKSHDGAGVWDTTTGEKVVGGANFCFHPDGRQPVHRAYQYYATPYVYQAFGRPFIQCVDGAEASLDDYFVPAAKWNNLQQFDAIVPGYGKPERNATVGARYGLNAVDSNGFLITDARGLNENQRYDQVAGTPTSLGAINYAEGNKLGGIEQGANRITGTSQIADDAGLGKTSEWGQTAGRPTNLRGLDYIADDKLVGIAPGAGTSNVLTPIGSYSVVRGNTVQKVGGTHGAFEGGAVGGGQVGGAWISGSLIAVAQGGSWYTYLALDLSRTNLDSNGVTYLAQYIASTAGSGYVRLYRAGVLVAERPVTSTGSASRMRLSYQGKRVWVAIDGVTYAELTNEQANQTLFPKVIDYFLTGPSGYAVTDVQYGQPGAAPALTFSPDHAVATTSVLPPVINGDTIAKGARHAYAWDTAVFSREAIDGPCTVSFKLEGVGMVGLSESMGAGTGNDSYLQIRLGIYTGGTPGVVPTYIWSGGGAVANLGTAFNGVTFSRNTRWEVVKNGLALYVYADDQLMGGPYPLPAGDPALRMVCYPCDQTFVARDLVFRAYADVTALNQHGMADLPPITLQYDYQGNRQTALPLAVVAGRKLGNRDVSAQSSYSVDGTGFTYTIDNTPGSAQRGTFTLTGFTGDSGTTVTIVSTYSGIQLARSFKLFKQSGAPPASGGGGGGGAPGNPATTTGPFSDPGTSASDVQLWALSAVTVGSSGNVKVTCNIGYAQREHAGTFTEPESPVPTTLVAQLQRRIGGGAWTDLTAANNHGVGTGASKFRSRSEDEDYKGRTIYSYNEFNLGGSIQLTCTDTGLPSGASVEYRMVGHADPTAYGINGLSGTAGATPQ